MYNTPFTSDVTIIEIEIEIAIFRKIKWNWYRDIWSKCDLILTPCRPTGTNDQCRRSQNGFYTLAIRSCRVQRSLYLWLRILGRKNWNWIYIKFLNKKLNREVKTIIITSLPFTVENVNIFTAMLCLQTCWHHQPLFGSEVQSSIRVVEG